MERRELAGSWTGQPQNRSLFSVVCIGHLRPRPGAARTLFYLAPYRAPRFACTRFVCAVAKKAAQRCAARPRCCRELCLRHPPPTSTHTHTSTHPTNTHALKPYLPDGGRQDRPGLHPQLFPDRRHYDRHCKAWHRKGASQRLECVRASLPLATTVVSRWVSACSVGISQSSSAQAPAQDLPSAPIMQLHTTTGSRCRARLNHDIGFAALAPNTREPATAQASKLQAPKQNVLITEEGSDDG